MCILWLKPRPLTNGRSRFTKTGHFSSMRSASQLLTEFAFTCEGAPVVFMLLPLANSQHQRSLWLHFWSDSGLYCTSRVPHDPYHSQHTQLHGPPGVRMPLSQLYVTGNKSQWESRLGQFKVWEREAMKNQKENWFLNTVRPHTCFDIMDDSKYSIVVLSLQDLLLSVDFQKPLKCNLRDLPVLCFSNIPFKVE